MPLCFDLSGLSFRRRLPRLFKRLFGGDVHRLGNHLTVRIRGKGRSQRQRLAQRDLAVAGEG